jgi:hypothetical protein
VYAEEEPAFVEYGAELEAEAETEADAELEGESMLNLALEAQTEAELEADAEAELDADAEAETEADAEAEEELDADAEAETEADAEADAEEEVEAKEEPAAAPAAAAPATETIPLVPNPHAPCGCYNNASCRNNVCYCTPQWTGNWCERPSMLFAQRQIELERLENLTKVVSNMSRQVYEIKAVSGSPDALKVLVAEAAQKEVKRLNTQNAQRLFYRALSSNDMFTARNQLNLIKFLDYDTFVPLERELALHEQRIASQFNTTKKQIEQMPVPVTQEAKYQDIDTKKAKDLRQATFTKSKELMEKAAELGRQFNLDFGDAV